MVDSNEKSQKKEDNFRFDQVTPKYKVLLK